MTSLEFCYWLQGFLELTSNDRFRHLNNEQIKVVEDHLKLVFEKKTPNTKYSGGTIPGTENFDFIPAVLTPGYQIQSPLAVTLFEGSC